MEPHRGLLQPAQAEASAFEVVDRSEGDARTERTSEVTDRPCQPDARDPVDRVAIARVDLAGVQQYQSGLGRRSTTSRPDHLDRRIDVEPVEPVQPGCCCAGGQEAAAARMDGHPQPLAHRRRRGREREYPRHGLAHRPGIEGTPDDTPRHAHRGGLPSGEGAVFSAASNAASRQASPVGIDRVVPPSLTSGDGTDPPAKCGRSVPETAPRRCTSAQRGFVIAPRSAPWASLAYLASTPVV